jgi:integron integrase
MRSATALASGTLDERWLAREAPPRAPRLLEVMRDALRARHYSRRTEKAYLGWVRRYILFHGRRHPREMGAAEVTRFLTALAVERRVSASTQNQALGALLFLHRHVLGLELPWLDELVRARRPRHLPVVLTRDEVAAVLAQMAGTPRLMATLLYGAGLRLLECARLRVKDVDFQASQLVIRRGKGARDRVTVLPRSVQAPLRSHLDRVRRLHDDDARRGAGWVELSDALARKYPNAGREWPWQWVFPATRTYRDPATGRDLSHVPPFLRDARPRGGLRHPDGAGAAGTSRRHDDDDLHARAEPGPGGGAVAGRRAPGPASVFRRRPPRADIALRSAAAPHSAPEAERGMTSQVRDSSGALPVVRPPAARCYTDRDCSVRRATRTCPSIVGWSAVARIGRKPP